MNNFIPLRNKIVSLFIPLVMNFGGREINGKMVKDQITDYRLNLDDIK